ncbi:ribosomal protein L7/L12 [Streptomyces sp. 1331.2]|uniref:ribosomal protein L7/L12 n=1 Tax=Streptomyces sp. 1331.2 TaxID=1938835 RepID=UPI000BD637A3|nr:ribosomal protein L7/L12 [Streptomyces sp. 1331.2]SOB81369.1 large subunit ribosomal protein L7/L12 [Streptomyces sp. 1331.2]
MTAYFTLVCDDIPHNVVLLGAGPSPLEVAKTFRTVTGGGLWHAKQTVTDTPPVLLFEGIEEKAARRHAEDLRAAGATVTVEPWVREHPA